MFARGAKAERDFSFIGPEMIVTGNIVTNGRLHVDGIVNGDIRCGTLTQGSSGAVHGNLLVEEARLGGLVDGAVEAGTLTLEPSARITGDVLYESLGIAAGAQVEGRFRRRKGPSDQGAASAREEGARALAGASDVVGGTAEMPTRPQSRRAPKRPEAAELFGPVPAPREAEAAE